MPRDVSDFTVMVWWWLWRLPWASAADLALVMTISHQEKFSPGAVSMVLDRGVRNGRLRRAKLGRVRDAVWRYVFSETGVREMQTRWEWDLYWWHTAKGVKALARRLQVVEIAYSYLPQLWQSNAVSIHRCYVYREKQERAWQTGKPVVRAELMLTNWRRGRLTGFHWLEDGPFEAVVTYDDGDSNEDLLYIPVLLRGDLHKPSDIASLRRDMTQVLEMDMRWSKLPEAQALSRHYCPGAVIFCQDRVSAGLAQRAWMESQTKDNWTTVAIVDDEGQVIRPMARPTTWWRGFRAPALDPKASLGDISRAVGQLGRGAYATVNGRQRWSMLRSFDRAPGVKKEHIEESTGVKQAIAAQSLEKMKKGKVMSVWREGHYLARSGRGLLADFQRQSNARVKKRWGKYADEDSNYRRDRRSHNEGQADANMHLSQHGYLTFPAMGISIIYPDGNKDIRVDPDGFILLPPGVLAALEFEQSSIAPSQVRKKVSGGRKMPGKETP